jgi:putative transposase
VIVAKRQRRLSNIDEIVLSLYARGLTTGDIAAHFAQIYGAQVSKDTISRITDRVVKVRDGQVGKRPVYAAIGVDLEGHKDILGMWFGDGGGESAKFWLAVLTELRNRGVVDVFFLVCDGLKGLPDSVAAVWPATIVQTCIIHLVDLWAAARDGVSNSDTIGAAASSAARAAPNVGASEPALRPRTS